MGFIVSAVVTFIFNIILAFLKLIIRIIKKILIATRLIVPAGIALVFVILFALGIIEKTAFNMLIAAICCGASLLYIIYRSIKKRIDRISEGKKKGVPERDEKPKIYRVKQNPEFVMHEYPDRVELYKETKQGKKYIRTDRF